MNLISCDNCGIVLDKDNLNFPEDIYDNDNCIDDNLAAWDGSTYVSKVKCPVCNEDILDN